jgi:hypothetical protein
MKFSSCDRIALIQKENIKDWYATKNIISNYDKINLHIVKNTHGLIHDLKKLSKPICVCFGEFIHYIDKKRALIQTI